ncbi:MAG: V-type ATP synthase subunit F [Steroidobacteraceae bacterium]
MSGAPLDAASSAPKPLAAARLIALGSVALMEGFALIGFETHADPTPQALEDLLRDLLQHQQAALVVIEQGLAQNPGRQLMRALREGARVVITEIPALQQPSRYCSRVDRLVESVLGSSALEPAP